jgi:hypothetical protein
MAQSDESTTDKTNEVQFDIGISVKPPDNFSFNPYDWSAWKKRFERYRSVSNLYKATNKRQVDMLCYCMGEKAEEIINSFGLSSVDLQDYDKVMGKFENHFVPKTNLIYQRAKFLRRKQGSTEIAENFITDLYTLAKLCSWGDLEDEMLLMQVIVGMQDQNLSDRLQLDSSLKLETAIDALRSSEALSRQRLDLSCTSVDQIRSNNSHKQKPVNKVNCSKNFNKQPCKWCGTSPSHRRGLCPAKNAKCNNCKSQGHFAKVCSKGKVNEVSNEVEINDDCISLSKSSSFIGSIGKNINTIGSNIDYWEIELTVNEIDNIKFKIDTGADVSIVPASI